MTMNKRRLFLAVSFAVVFGGALAWVFWPSPAPVPDQLEYLPAGSPPPVASEEQIQEALPDETAVGGRVALDLEAESLGGVPQSFVPAVGNWIIGQDGGNTVLVVDGRAWSEGKAAAGIADRARSLYGERYAEFLDNVKSFAYFPYAVAAGVEDFRNGEIALRFKGIDGRIDQAAGILFNLKTNGDYLALRANPLENNLVLWKFERGKRSSVEWVRDVRTPSSQWHDLKLKVAGTKVEGYVNGKLHLEYNLPQNVSGRVGLWSKADSVVYFDDIIVTPK